MRLKEENIRSFSSVGRERLGWLGIGKTPCREMGFPSGSVSEESACNAGDIGDTSSIPGLGRSPGGGHSNPLHYSCLENPMDRGTWQATIHRVEKSQARLKRLSTPTHCRKRNKCKLRLRGLKRLACLEKAAAILHGQEGSEQWAGRLLHITVWISGSILTRDSLEWLGFDDFARLRYLFGFIFGPHLTGLF